MPSRALSSMRVAFARLRNSFSGLQGADPSLELESESAFYLYRIGNVGCLEATIP